MDDESLVVELLDMEDADRLQEGLRTAHEPETDTADTEVRSAVQSSPLKTLLKIAIGIGIAVVIFWLL